MRSRLDGETLERLGGRLIAAAAGPTRLPEISAPPAGGSRSKCAGAPRQCRFEAALGASYGIKLRRDGKSVVGTVRDHVSSRCAMQIDDIMSPFSLKPAATIVGDLFIDHDDVVEEAFALMVETLVTTLPVLGPERDVVGIVSYRAVLRSLPEARPTVLARSAQRGLRLERSLRPI